MRMAKVLAFFFLATLLWGCKKEKMSPIPAIKFVEQSRYEIADSGKGVENPILFQFTFEDGGADIGPLDFPTPLQNIYFIDSRTETPSFFDFPPIPSTVVSEDGISGSFTVSMDPRTLIARDDTTIHKLTDTVRWTVYVRDGQDNFSNEVFTDSIVIVK